MPARCVCVQLRAFSEAGSLHAAKRSRGYTGAECKQKEGRCKGVPPLQYADGAYSRPLLETTSETAHDCLKSEDPSAPRRSERPHAPPVYFKAE